MKGSTSFWFASRGDIVTGLSTYPSDHILFSRCQLLNCRAYIRIVLIPLVLVCLNCELCNPIIGCVRSAQKYLSLDLYSIFSLFTLLLKLVSDGDEEQQQKTLFHCFTCYSSCISIGIVSYALFIPYIFTFINIVFRYDSDLQ